MITVNNINRSFLMFLTTLLCACGGGDSLLEDELSSLPNDTNTQLTSKVYAMPTFNVTIDSDIKFAEGLSHATWNSSATITKDLLLDVYKPDNSDTKRPLILYIHGGGFIFGDKSVDAAYNQLMFFAERGFVGISINYRLLDDYGTLPNTLMNAIDNTNEIPAIQKDLYKAMYPAIRDAKAAVRWSYKNQELLGIDTNHITVIGASAGAVIAIALGAVESSDYSSELSLSEDPSLSTTHLSEDSQVHTIIDYWGSGVGVSLLDLINTEPRWDANDAPLSIIHGTNDQIVSFDQAEALRYKYMISGAEHEFYPLVGESHGAWQATVNGKTLFDLALEFIISSQALEFVE